MRYRFFVVFVMLLNGTASAGVFGYDNYWDCILDQMPGVQNDVAAGAVMRQCHVQAPNRAVERKRSTFLGMNAEKCLLKNGKKVRSERAAVQIRLACRSLYE